MDKHTNEHTNEATEPLCPVCLVILLMIIACQLVGIGACLAYLITTA